MNRRARAIVSGKVQGAAYRDAVQRMAYENHIAGTVGNRDDGTVEVICEGKEKVLADFLKRINFKRWPIMVEKIKVTYEKPTGEFQGFSVIRGEVSTRDILDRLDLGMNYMSELNEKQDRTIDAVKAVDGNVKRTGSGIRSVGSGIRSVGSGIKSVGASIKSMDSHIGGHFEKLDKKYDRFGNTLSGAARDIRAMGGDTRTMKGDMKSVRGDIRGMRGDIGHVRSDMHGLASPRRRKKA
jgi:acylphosphatase